MEKEMRAVSLSILVAALLCGMPGCSQPEKTCKTNDDCLGTEACVGKKCIDLSCSASSDCSADEACLGGKCQKRSESKGCKSDSDCQSNQLCENRECKERKDGGCKNECEIGKDRCSGNGVQSCVTLASGCLQWGAAAQCRGIGMACRDGKCVSTCNNTCSQEFAGRCVDASKYQVCKQDSTGCLSWGNAQACPSGKTCSNGGCLTVKSKEGEGCSVQADCQSGLVCVSEGLGSSCTRLCSRSADCPAGKACYDSSSGGKACFHVTFPPFDAKCKILVYSADINGGSWDAFGGAPDPYINVSIGSDNNYTATRSDTFSPVWNYETDQKYSYQDILGMVVGMYDEDISGSDTMVVWDHENFKRWIMTDSTSKSFTLGTTDNSITLRMAIKCTY